MQSGLYVTGSYVYINGGMIINQFMSEVCSGALVNTVVIDLNGEWYILIFM
jgi:hypothetical protein